MTATLSERLQQAMEKMPKGGTLPFDPFAIAQATTEFAASFKPSDLLEVQLQAARQWGEFWTRALTPNAEPAC